MHCEFIGALEVTYGHALAGGGGFRRVTTPEGSAAELTPATFLWFKPSSNSATAAASSAPALAVVHLHIAGEEKPTDFPVEPPPSTPSSSSTSSKRGSQLHCNAQWVRMDKPIDRVHGLYVWYLARDWRGPPTLKSPRTDENDEGGATTAAVAVHALRPLKDIRVVRDRKDVPAGFECVTAPPLVTETTDDKGKVQELRSFVCYKRLDDEDLSGSTWTLAGQKAGTWVDVRDLASNRWRVGQIINVSTNECRISVATWSKKATAAFRDDVVSFAMSRNRVAPLGSHTDLHLSPSYPLCRKQGSPWNLTLKDLDQSRSDFDLLFNQTDDATQLQYVKQSLLPLVEKSMVSLFYSNELAEQVSLFHQHVVKSIVTWFVARGSASTSTSANGESASGSSDSRKTEDDEQNDLVRCMLSILRLVLSGMTAPTAAMFFYIKYAGSYATVKTPPTLVYTTHLTSTEAMAAAPMRHPCRSSFFVDAVEVFLQAGGFRFMLDRVGRRDVPLVEIAVIAMILLSAKPCLILPPKRKRNSTASLAASSSGRRKSSLALENQQLVEDFFREFLQSTLARLRRMKGEELKDEDGLVEHIVSVLDGVYRDGLFIGNDDSSSQLSSTAEFSSTDNSPPTSSSSSEVAFAEVFEMFHLDLSKKYICCPFLAQRLLGVARLSDLITMAQRHDSMQKKTSFNLKRTAAGAAATAASSLGLGSSLGGSSSSDANGSSSTKWLRYKFISEWLVDSDVIEVILGQKEACAKYGMREGIHLELLKRSRSLLEALTQSGYLSDTHLSLVWKAAMGQLRTGRKAVLDLLISLCGEMTADMLDIVMVLLTQVAVGDYDELLLQFIQKLIEIASKNAIEAENGAKKSTITSFVGVHSKRTQGAQRDSETSNKIVGLGLSLLWSAIEHHSNGDSARADPTGALAKSVTPALAVAFAESLNHVHRTWAASGLSSSSAKEQQQLLSQYVTKCVGLIKAGGELTDMAMVIIQKVVENYGRTASSSSSTLAIARSTFQGGSLSTAGAATSGDLVKELQSKHSLLSLVVGEIERCVRDDREQRKCQKWRPDDAKQPASCHRVVQKRLSFLAFLATSSDLELPYKHIERLWACFVKGSDGTTKEERLNEEELRDVFFNWLSSIVADPSDFVQRTYAGKHALTPATTEELFGDLTAPPSSTKARTVELTIATMRPSAFWTFERLFRYVNVADKRMSCEAPKSMLATGSSNSSSQVMVESMELKGYEKLFDIALGAHQDVSDAAMNYLIHLHTRLGSKLVRREVWTDFARGCVSRLSKMKASTGESTSNQEIARVLVLLNTLLFQSTMQDAESGGDLASTVDDLTVYVRTQDGRAAAPFYFKLKRTVLVGELRDLIARDSSHPADRVRLVNDRKVKLTSQGHDRLTLEKAQVIRPNGVSSVSSKAAIAVANTPEKRKNFVEAVLLNRPDSDTVGHVERPVLVGDTGLGKEMNDWEAVKFELSSSRILKSLQQFLSMAGDVSEEAWKLLKQLNYDSAMEKKIRTLDDALNIDGSTKKGASVQDWGKLLDVTSPPRLLYQVELVERFALTKAHSSQSSEENEHQTPPKDRDDRASVANAWSESFSSLGGQAHLKDFVLALDSQHLVAQKQSLTAMCLARVFGLLDHLILLDVQTTQHRPDGSYESLLIKIFDTLRTIQGSESDHALEPKSDQTAKATASLHTRGSIPTYARPDLRSTDDAEASAISVEALLVIGALRLLSTSALAHAQSLPNDTAATITLLRSFPDAGSILLKYLVKFPEEAVRKEAHDTIAGLSSPLKNQRGSGGSQCRQYFLRLLAESGELAQHVEYYRLYTHLINPQVGQLGSGKSDDDDLTCFEFLPASVKLCRTIVNFPEATIKKPSPSQHFKSSLSPAPKKGKKDPAPDAVYQALLSTLLAVLQTIPPILADGHQSPNGEPQSLREVVVGTINADEGIIEELFTHGLFPANASVTGEKNEDDERSAQYYLKQPKCKSDSCRKVAFELLRELATESVDGLRYLFGQMTEHHSLTPPPDPSAGTATTTSLAAPLSSTSKKKTRPSVTKALDYHSLERGKYVGLKNLGCTCYMNSTVQAFFMIPRLRRQILRCASQPNGLVYQLQSVFAHLEGSAKAYYNPKALTLAMKTWEGEPIDVNEQQDASEFLTSFFQQIESEMNGRNEVAESTDSGSTLVGRTGTDESILNSFFGGVFSNELVAEGDRYSERFEPFHFISVPVRDRKNLQESLDSWAEGDKVSYTWESPASDSDATSEVDKVTLDTHKRISIHKLPDQLIIHLKRFEFDFEAMQQTKIHDRFEFPTELDMYPYTKEGQAEQRSQSRKRSQSRAAQKSDVRVDTSNRSRAPEYYQYELVGTVVHMGTAHSGHYYSFLRDHETSKSASDGTPSGQPQQWYEFNDTHVTPFDAADIPEECFGGQDDEREDGTGTAGAAARKRKKTRSSFMLFYSRRQPKLHLPTLPLAPLARKPLSVYASVLWFIARLKTRAQSRMEYLRSRSHILAPEPIRAQILLENRMFWRKKYLFNRHYLDFTFQLLSGCTSAPAHDGTISFDGPMEVRLQALQLATRFVFGTLWQSGDIAAVLKWKPALCALYREDVGGSQWLLSTLRENDALLLEFLVSNEHAEVRELMAVVLEEAIATTSHSAAIAISQNPSSDRPSRRRRSSTTLPPSFEFMFLLYRLMPWLLTVPVTQHQQYFEVLLTFALTGQNECTFTVVNSVVGAIGALLTGVGSSQPLLQGELKRVKGRTILKRMELDFVELKLLSLLIRIVPPPDMDVAGTQLLPPSMAANPNAPSLPVGDHDVLLSERFVTLLSQHASHYTKSTKSLEQIVMHLCWQSRRVTGLFMDVIMHGIESEDHDDVKPYFRTLNAIYKIKDTLALERLDDGMTKLVAIMASQQKYFKATEASIDMLTRLAKRHPRSVAHWVRKHQANCAWMEKWLLAHRGADGFLQQGRTALVKPKSTSSWATVSVQSDQLVRNVDRSMAKLLPRVRSMLDAKDGMETFYDSDDNPARLVGKRVRVKWAKEKWYEGFVERFDERLYEHLIVYDDGDKRQYRMSDKVFYVVEMPPPNTGEASASASTTPMRRRESSSADL